MRIIRQIVCVLYENACMFFLSEISEECSREWASERERERERKKKGPCIGGGVEWMRQLYSPLNSYKKYPPPKSYTTPPPVAPSHSNYEPRAGRSEYNFLYCVNVRTYVWIRKMFILQKKKKKQWVYFLVIFYFPCYSIKSIISMWRLRFSKFE